MRRTSIEAYEKIRDEGLLSKMRWIVYDLLFAHGPATAAELASRFPPSVGGRGQAGNVHARLGELRDVGCVAEIGERECTITRNNVILWDVTDGLPKKFERRPSERDALRAKIADLETENARLRDKLARAGCLFCS